MHFSIFHIFQWVSHSTGHWHVGHFPGFCFGYLPIWIQNLLDRWLQQWLNIWERRFPERRIINQSSFTGWKIDLFNGWGEFFLLGGCGMMICVMDTIPVQTSIFIAGEVSTLNSPESIWGIHYWFIGDFVGSFGQIDLDAQVIGVNFAEISYTVSLSICHIWCSWIWTWFIIQLPCLFVQVLMGFGSASAILIGSYLGGNKPNRAKQAATITFIISSNAIPNIGIVKQQMKMSCITSCIVLTQVLQC